MASWQPPIPAGALYSSHAIELGAGLALLAWCYDQVLRDGTVQVNLEKAAADLGTPYGTVRDWWRRMKGDETIKSHFFSEITPQGRKGWHVKFKTRWIDWRIIEKNYPQRQDFSDEDENTADIPAVNDDQENTAEISEISSQNNRRNSSDQGSAYKVLIPTDQAGDERDDAKASRTPRKKEPKAEKPATPKPIRDALAEVCQIGKLSTREQVLQLNQSAAAIWKAQADDGREPEQIAADIRYVAGYFKRQDWRGKRGDLPRPADVREVWQPAMAARTAAKPPETKYYQSQAHKYPPEEERRRLLVEGLARRTAIRNVGDS